MKFLTVLSFFILIGCNNQSKTGSDFDLITDYADFQKKMNDKDTINVWVAIPSCFPPIQVEKLVISKQNKLIKITTLFNSDVFKSNSFVEQSKITISENDTVWKFDAFLKKNMFRKKTEIYKKTGAIILKYKSQKIQFFTKNKAEHNMLIMDYTKTMKRINPNAKTYITEVKLM